MEQFSLSPGFLFFSKSITKWLLVMHFWSRKHRIVIKKNKQTKNKKKTKQNNPLEAFEAQIDPL